MTDQFEVGYALLIGVDENAVPDLALPDVAKDIAALQAVLVHPQRCAYPADNVKVITGSAATRQGIQDGLDWLDEKLRAGSSDNTTAVIYYSGHGWQDSDASPPAYYLIPYDMQQGSYHRRALPAARFAEDVSGLRPRRLLVILDCCHAAGIEAKDVGAVAGVYRETAIPPHVLMAGEKAVATTGAKDIFALAQGAGRAVLSSSQGTQKSYIRQDRKMSIFTYHLIEALTGHAQPQEGAQEVLVSDVMSHVTRTVPKSAEREARAAQTPDFQVSGNFPVALLLGGKGLSKGMAPPDPIEDTPEVVRAIRQINTGGGAYIGGSVNAGGDFVGRDRVTYGDTVHGDKVAGDKVGGNKTSVGNISGSHAVNIGDGTLTYTSGGHSAADLERLFIPLLQAVQSAPAQNQAAAAAKVEALKQEVAKGDDAGDEQMASLVDDLAGLVPGAIDALVGLFAPAALGKLAGGATNYVLKRLRGR